jgi:hypothetical protein
MTHQFQKHYTREEARALLPQLRTWLGRLQEIQAGLETSNERLAGMMTPGRDMGGELVNQAVKLLSEMKGLFHEFEQRGIVIKDLQRGLVDFPAIIGDREVFLCWEKDEEDVEFWHDIDSGYAGREPL